MHGHPENHSDVRKLSDSSIPFRDFDRAAPSRRQAEMGVVGSRRDFWQNEESERLLFHVLFCIRSSIR